MHAREHTHRAGGGRERERAPGISPVIVHDSYGQVNLVNAFRRDIKDYGFIVNGIKRVPLGRCFPFLQSPAVTHQ